MCVILYNIASLVKRARFLVSLQLVSGTRTYLRPLSSAVISHSQYLQQNQAQTPVSLVSGPGVLACRSPLALGILHNFRDQGYISVSWPPRGVSRTSRGDFRVLVSIGGEI